MEQAVNLVYTLKLKIPIGEAVIRNDGSHVLRVKNLRTHKAVVQTASQSSREDSSDGGYAPYKATNHQPSWWFVTISAL